MEPSSGCPVCGDRADGRPILVRSGRPMTLWCCRACEFEFFIHDPTPQIATDQADASRLNAVGMAIPPPEEDFANGLRQAASYIGEYLDASDGGRNVLEIGCSWGYFLKLAHEAGAAPYGVELNAVRARHVRDHLGIPCDDSLDACERRSLRFKQIFLFYVLESIPQPLQYVRRLVTLLDQDGRLVVITPSLRDPLKDLWQNGGFLRFFYEENSINYFSPKAVRRLCDRINAGQVSVTTRQGYSFANHMNWFLTNGPRTTGIVGGDNFVRNMIQQLSAQPRTAGEVTEFGARADHLAKLIEEFDASYRRYLESQDMGNQIRFTVRK